MSKIEKRNNSYYLITEDGHETLVPTKIDAKTGVEWLKLPENPEGRQWMSSNKFKDTNVVELAPHIDRAPTTRSNWMDYLTEEEKDNLTRAEEALEAMRTEYKREAMARKDSQKEVPMTKEEKLRAKIAKLEAQLAKMESEEA